MYCWDEAGEIKGEMSLMPSDCTKEVLISGSLNMAAKQLTAVGIALVG